MCLKIVLKSLWVYRERKGKIMKEFIWRTEMTNSAVNRNIIGISPNDKKISGNSQNKYTCIF